MVAERNLVLTLRAAERIRPELEQLPAIGVIERYDLSHSGDDDVLARGLAGAWGTIAGSEHYSRAVLEAVGGLRAILRWGTGSDAIDIEAATDAGVAVITTPGVNAEAVADMALALMLACIRGLPRLDGAVRSGRWRTHEPSRDLAGATVGVVGLGAVGRAVVRRLRGFDCRVLVLEPHPDVEFAAAHDVELAELDAILPQVDALTLHAPLTDATRHLLGPREFGLLPRHAVVVNTARGELIDQDALVEALENEEIAGAGLDVFEHEPLVPGDPILSVRGALLSGHVGSFTELGLQRTGEAVLANLHAVLGGRLPQSCLNPEAWGRQSD